MTGPICRMCKRPIPYGRFVIFDEKVIYFCDMCTNLGLGSLMDKMSGDLR